MAIITTYVCDVSGVQGAKEDFVNVTINAQSNKSNAFYTKKSVTKVVHMDVARRLNLLSEKTTEPVQEPTFESKLGALLREYVEEIAYESAETAISNSRN